MKYCVFDTKQEAENAELYIREIANAPLIGTNALTGEPEPDKQRTEGWAVPEQRADGKWIFPVVPDEILAQYPHEQVDSFFSAFNLAIEDYSPDWFIEN